MRLARGSDAARAERAPRAQRARRDSVRVLGLPRIRRASDSSCEGQRVGTRVLLFLRSTVTSLLSSFSHPAAPASRSWSILILVVGATTPPAIADASINLDENRAKSECAGATLCGVWSLRPCFTPRVLPVFSPFLSTACTYALGSTSTVVARPHRDINFLVT